MKKETIIILVLLVTLLVRFVWAKLGWSGESLLIYPPLLALLALLYYYHNELQHTFYKVIILFFAVYILSIVFNIAEWRGRGLLLFIGSMGFVLFAVRFFLLQKKQMNNPLLSYCIVLGIIIMIQTIIYLFIPTSDLLTFAHMLCFGILILSGLILFKKRLRNEISGDEKMILTFLIIVNILSLMGVTFKESFYSSIWI